MSKAHRNQGWTRNGTAFAGFLLLLLAAGCGMPPPIPDDNLYDLHSSERMRALPEPLFDGQLVVRAPRAVGARGERSVLYTSAEGEATLSGYHYHQWIDSPTVLLQRRLILSLRDANVSSLVSDRAAERLEIATVTGHLDRFERVRDDGQWRAVVHWEIRVDLGEGRGEPVLLKTYRQSVLAETSEMAATATAFSTAVDRIVATFVSDLEAALN